MSDSDEAAIRRLYTQYNRAIDSGDADAWAGTFVPAGIFHHPARDWSGHDELRRFVVERTAKFDQNEIADQRHWNDALVVDVAGESATAHCDLLVAGRSREDGSMKVAATGRYEDLLENTPAGWKFVSRRLTLP